MNRVEFRIAKDHPCLSGHFPGHPIVPAVVILERVIDAVVDASECRVVGIRRCKFTGLLRPDQTCRVEWTRADHAVRFACSTSSGAVAHGTLQVADG